ncbi:MAG: hypothetical protein LBC47_01620 [Tannerella sp.]|jgi:hypothetical protein|nr:hypothetical protein [Tannerella sp.]
MKRVNLKRILSYLPEAVVLLVAMYWFVDSLLGASRVNWFMAGVIVVILALLIRRSRVLAVALSVVVGLGSFYMLLAVLSEYHEFPAGDPSGVQLLLTGSLICVSFGIMSVIMPWKYFRQGN